MTATVLVATAGQGILRSNDDGKTWHRLGLEEPIEFDGIVRALAVDQTNPARIYAGADAGLCISDDGGAHWHRPDNILNGQTVWSIAIDPKDASVLYAGTGAPSRAAIFKSTDAGQTWTKLPPDIPEFCSGVNRPRLLTICVDPEDSRNVWFGIEEGGAWRSRDAGDSWTRIDGPGSAIRNSDIHAIVVLSATMLIASNKRYGILQTELARSGLPLDAPNSSRLTLLDDPPIDWPALSQGYGVPCERVRTTQELAAALTRALAHTSGPLLIEMCLP